VATDCDDADRYLVTAPPIGKGGQGRPSGAHSILIVPICGMQRHKTWRQNSPVQDLPHHNGPCNYCMPGAAPGLAESDRCDDYCELVVAAIEGNPQDPASMRFSGLYLIPAKSSSRDEVYSFWFHEVVGRTNAGQIPWANMYWLTYQPITSKRTGFNWSIYRFVRQGDSVQNRQWVKEGKLADGSIEKPLYYVWPTPSHIVAEVQSRLTGNTLEMAAIQLLLLPADQAYTQVRKMIMARGGKAVLQPVQTPFAPVQPQFGAAQQAPFQQAPVQVPFQAPVQQAPVQQAPVQQAPVAQPVINQVPPPAPQDDAPPFDMPQQQVPVQAPIPPQVQVQAQAPVQAPAPQQPPFIPPAPVQVFQPPQQPLQAPGAGIPVFVPPGPGPSAVAPGAVIPQQQAVSDFLSSAFSQIN